MKNCYNINFSKLAVSSLASRIRKPVLIAWLLILVRPLEELHSAFLEHAGFLNTEPGSQICRMKKLLNDEFDYYERRIKVRTPKPDFDALLTWGRQTVRRTLVGRRGSGSECLRNASGQLGKNSTSFEVVFPAEFWLSESERNRAIALVNNNKLASKQYIITYE